MSIFDGFKNIAGNKKDTPQVTPQQPIPSKKVLIVEDEEALREFYADLLQQQGYVILKAQNGQEGLAAVTSQKPDLVLLDIMMPVMDGKTMLEKVRAIPEFKTLPVIVLTNAGDVDTMKDMRPYEGVEDFFIKANITPDEIVNRVKNILSF